MGLWRDGEGVGIALIEDPLSLQLGVSDSTGWERCGTIAGE